MTSDPRPSVPLPRSERAENLVPVERFCLGGWDGCKEIYTGGHRCEYMDGHKGRCKCICGATTTEKPPSWDCDHAEGGGWIETESGSELRCLLCGDPLAKGWSE